jgi:hypothetical protein
MGCSVAGCCGACLVDMLDLVECIDPCIGSIRPSHHAKGQVQIVMIVVINREKVDRDRWIGYMDRDR